MKVVVIGTGIAGLACSIRLAVQGHKVTVLEANDTPGGKISCLAQDGFRFGRGPALLAMPELVDELFVLAGKNPRNYFQYAQLDISHRYFYADKTVLNAYVDPALLEKEVRVKLSTDPTAVTNYLANSAHLFSLIQKSLIEKSFRRWTDYFSKDALRLATHLFQLPLIGSLHRNNRLQLTHSKLVQLFDHLASYTGSSPYNVSGMLQVYAHMMLNRGAFWPIDGMYSLVHRLVQLGQELGVEYHYGTQAQEIMLAHGRVQGVRTSTDTLKADVVVSNVDIVNTYRHLLPTLQAPQHIVDSTRSSAALVFYWGISRQFKQLAIQNVFLSQDCAQEAATLFEAQQVPQDPTLQVSITAKEQPQDAPEDCENWVVTMQVPANQGQDWGQIVRQARSQVLDKLRRTLGQDISTLICSERIEDPRDLERNTLAYQGALYGGTVNNQLYSLLGRPSNYARATPGLYFCGGTVHPGGGIPFCVLSAKIVAEQVAQCSKQLCPEGVQEG